MVEKVEERIDKLLHYFEELVGPAVFCKWYREDNVVKYFTPYGLVIIGEASLMNYRDEQLEGVAAEEIENLRYKRNLYQE